MKYKKLLIIKSYSISKALSWFLENSPHPQKKVTAWRLWYRKLTWGVRSLWKQSFSTIHNNTMVSTIKLRMIQNHETDKISCSELIKNLWVRLITNKSSTRVESLSNRMWERDTSVGSKVTNTLLIFSRTELFHLAAEMIYHCKSLHDCMSCL